MAEKVTAKTAHCIKGYAEFFIDLCLQEYEFQKFDSHTLACAVILAARRIVHMKRTWNDEFYRLLDCNLKEIEK